MKKLLITLMLVITFGGIALADTYVHNDSPLPESAKSVIKKNFKSGVSVVKIDKDFGRIDEYDVVLTDGTEISFDSKGNWKDVEVSANSSVPSGFILEPINSYVKKNHPGVKIVGVEKGRKKIEVTLSNGIEIEFNKAGNFLRYDK